MRVSPREFDSPKAGNFLIFLEQKENSSLVYVVKIRFIYLVFVLNEKKKKKKKIDFIIIIKIKDRYTFQII